MVVVIDSLCIILAILTLFDENLIRSNYERYDLIPVAIPLS